MTVVVLTVGCEVGDDVPAVDVGAVDALGEADVEAAVEVEVAVEAAVDVEVDPPGNRGWRNSIQESRYSTLSPSDTSSMVGDTAYVTPLLVATMVPSAPRAAGIDRPAWSANRSPRYSSCPVGLTQITTSAREVRP